MEAIAEYDETIHLNPQDTNAYVNRGAAYDDLGQYQRGSQDYDEAIRLDPHADAYADRASSYTLRMQRLSKI